ncbi:MAG TPA: VOC family protein [Caldimonas sp.]|nr:VOC family protein [Caldimonas sp.]
MGVNAAPSAPTVALDHLVVACSSLDAGRTWCEETFGVAPEPGGHHARMGTHNLLLSLATERFPKAYLELISIDPQAPAPAQPRWFDLDDASLQAAIASTPRLVHWVARSDDVAATVAALRAIDADPGRIVDAERMTLRGMLRWRITLPAGGRRPSGGAMPLWIQWSGEHPVDALPVSGVAIDAIELGGITPELSSQLGTLVRCTASSIPLSAALTGPRGPVRLASPAPSVSA